MHAIVRGPRFWRGLLYFLLACPLFVSGPLPGFAAPLIVCWPRIHSGDEPHYLLMLTSLIQDGDLDLANDYTAVHRGGLGAGRSFAGQPIDHHVSWWIGGRLFYWWEFFEQNPDRWKRDDNGHPVPTPKTRSAPSFLPPHEYSQHPPGLAMLLAPFAFPCRGTPCVESVALIGTTVTVILGAVFFEALIAPFTISWQQRLTVTAIAFLGTPLWHYARTLFVEPYLATLCLGAYACTLRFRAFAWAGVLIGMGLLMKPPFALLAIPLWGVCWARRDYRGAIILTLPIVSAALAILALNQFMHGSVLSSSIAWRSGNVLRGAMGLVFSPEHGLLPFSPSALLAIMTFRRFLAKHRRDGLVIAAGVVLYCSCMSLWIDWHGGHCFGPRMIVPVIPLLFVALCETPNLFWMQHADGKVFAWTLVAGSVVFNGLGAFACGWAWSRHPLSFLSAWLGYGR